MKGHTLYRFFDADNVLLYVGRTTNPRQRWRKHEKEKDWFGDVATVTREVFDTAEEVDAAEREAIALEAPLHNIALNPRRRADVPMAFRTPSSAPRPTKLDKSHQARLSAAGEDEYPECLGDETACECALCHHLRTNRFENLRAEYGWHPDFWAAIDAVEKDYYAGDFLPDWYYDLFDISMFGKMRLVDESRRSPIPAYVEVENGLACVSCPFCFCDHKHYLVSGASLDEPLAAPCGPAGLESPRYVLVDDWALLLDAQYRWGEHSARMAGAA